MPTPTVTITLPYTATVWAAGRGDDMGAWVIQGITTWDYLAYCLAIVLGFWFALRLLP